MKIFLSICFSVLMETCPANCTHQKIYFSLQSCGYLENFPRLPSKDEAKRFPIYLPLILWLTCFLTNRGLNESFNLHFCEVRNFDSTPLIKFILECKSHSATVASNTSRNNITDTANCHFTASPMWSMENISDTNSDLWFCWCFGNSLWSSAHKHLNFDNIPWITFVELVLKWNDTEMKTEKNTWRGFLFN